MSERPVSFTPPHELCFEYEDNVINSAFLRLPLHLRLKIYGYCIGGHWIEIHTNLYGWAKSRFYSDGNETEPKNENPKLFTLAETCRQMYAESWLLPFELNTFIVHTVEDLQSFVDCLGNVTCKSYSFSVRKKLRRNAIRALSLGQPLAWELAKDKDVQTITCCFPKIETVYLREWEYLRVGPSMLKMIHQVFKEAESNKLKIVLLETMKVHEDAEGLEDMIKESGDQKETEIEQDDDGLDTFNSEVHEEAHVEAVEEAVGEAHEETDET